MASVMGVAGVAMEDERQRRSKLPEFRKVYERAAVNILDRDLVGALFADYTMTAHAVSPGPAFDSSYTV